MGEIVFRSKQLPYGVLEFTAYMYSEEGCALSRLNTGTIDFTLRYRWDTGNSVSTDPMLSRCVPEEQFDRWLDSVSTESEFFRLKKETDAVVDKFVYAIRK